MVKKMLVLVIVFMMAGILPVMAEVEDGAPPWFLSNGDYSTWVDGGRAGPPPWAASRARLNWKMSSVVRSESDDEDDLGYPPWFTKPEDYEAWVAGDMEGPPPWAPLHARENYNRSLLNDEKNDEDEGNGPAWFQNQGAVQKWNAAGQEGPPPWAGVRGRKNK